MSTTRDALRDQTDGRCPFLSAQVRDNERRIKGENSRGVCTISSTSNGPRQDWLVCPIRVLDSNIVREAADRLFGRAGSLTPLVVPAPTIAREDVRAEIRQSLDSGRPTLVYLQQKLGGEITLSRSERSPEMAFDFTLVELLAQPGGFGIGRYGILEIQTMDFHGSYGSAVRDMRDALRLHEAGFHQTLAQNQRWLAHAIEGPNITNVFKRTFYQILIKFQVGAHHASAGCVLAIPAAVWDSWQRHLGKPELVPQPDGTYLLQGPHFDAASPSPRAWIYVFDIDPMSQASPNPIYLSKAIATDSDSMAFFAFKSAPGAAVAPGGPADEVPRAIASRLRAWWPELGGGL